MIERNSNTWLTICAELDHLIANATQQLISPATTPERTSFLRGQIAAWSAIADLSQDKPPLQSKPLR